MVLQALSSTAYLIVEASWQISTYIVPLFLAVEISRSYLKDVSKIKENIIQDSVPFVIAIVSSGSVMTVLGTNIGNSGLLGSLITVTFYGILFWHF